MTATKNSISVIICTKDREADLKEAVQSLLLQTRLPDELIVVDAGPQGAVEDLFSKLSCPFEVHYLRSEPGLTQQRNLGIEKSQGDLIFFFDDDILLEPHYIRRVFRVFERDMEKVIGAVMGRILFPKKDETLRVRVGRRITNAIRFIFLLEGFGDGSVKYSGLAMFPHHLSESRFVKCLSGCCMAFRYDVFFRMRFDDKLRGYALMEDQDIAKRVLDQGYKLYYEARAVLQHKASPTARLNSYRVMRMRVHNHAYLFRKNWPQNLVRRVAFWWSIVGLLVLSIRQRNLNGARGIIKGICDLLLTRGNEGCA